MQPCWSLILQIQRGRCCITGINIVALKLRAQYTCNIAAMRSFARKSQRISKRHESSSEYLQRHFIVRDPGSLVQLVAKGRTIADKNHVRDDIERRPIERRSLGFESIFQDERYIYIFCSSQRSRQVLDKVFAMAIAISQNVLGRYFHRLKNSRKL